MKLQNRVGWPAMTCVLCDPRGRSFVVVVVKTTFSLGPTRAAPAPVVLAPEWFGEPGGSALRYDTELTLQKAATDVIVHATAHAPHPVPAADVSVEVGPVRKRLRVFGDRHWISDGKRRLVSAPAPFTRMPIAYERAFGGRGAAGSLPENPIGLGYVEDARSLDGVRLPNIEDPEHPITSWQDRPAPRGLGPLCPLTAPRRPLFGTYDQAWRTTRSPLPPADYDPAALQCAPRDQRAAGHLAGDEPVRLRGLTPAGDTAFRLPGPAFACDLRIDAERRPVPLVLHTVCIEPDEQRVLLTWQGQVPAPAALGGREELVLRSRLGAS
jgi:hypothetical protein